MNPKLLFSLIIIALLSSCSKISDLTSTSSISGLDSEASHWTVSEEVCSGCPRSASLFSSCHSSLNEQIIFGGPNILGPDGLSTLGKYFEGLYSLGSNTLNALGFNFEFWVLSTAAISSFNVNNVVDFSVNGANFGLLNADYTTSNCLVNYTITSGPVTNAKLYYMTFKHIFPFNGASALAFRITSKLGVPSTTTSFGLRRLNIFLMDTPNHGSKNFPCDISYYWDDTTCAPCHAFCTTCNGPTNNDCSACLYPNYNYLNQTCLDFCPTTGPLNSTSSSSSYNYCRFKCGSGFYWAYNDSCTPTCSLPLVKTLGTYTTNNVDTCRSPCPTQYFYPNGTCDNTCGGLWTPIIEAANNVQYCKNPCGTANFMYPDGTCENSCPLPLLSRTEPGMKHCFTPCIPGDYLYWNSSCFTSCDPPLVQYTDSRNFSYCKNLCDPSTEFLYPDGTCEVSCPLPLLSRTEPGVMFCFTPCASGDYLYPNSSCFSSCDPPLLQVNDSGFQYCQNPCNSLEFLYPDGTCDSVCPAPLVSRTEPDFKYCFTPCAHGDYLYPNSSCFAACDAPLLQVNDSSFQYCQNPCNSLEFLYPNGSCNSICTAPLVSRTEPDFKYCFTPCDSDDYLYPNSSCFAACDSPLLQVTNGGFQYCQNPCNSSAFLYPDGTCNSTCEAPLLSRTEPNFKYCFTPCESDKFLFPNGSCLSTCPLPLIPMEESEKNFKFCTNPCDPLGSTTFLNPDSSCSSTCQSPLLSRSEPDVKYCFTPCAGNQYLYVNGTCSERCETPLLKKEEMTNTFKFCNNPCQPAISLFLLPYSSCNSTCSLPLFERIEPDVMYCYNPCVGNNTFLHENLQICQATCPYPSITKNEIYGKYCTFPCEDESFYWNMDDEKCEATCEYPSVARESPLPKLCSSELDDEDLKQIEKMASAVDTANSAVSTGNLIWNLINSGDSTAAMMGPLVKMLQYIKFMDIVFPGKVQLMLLEQSKKANKKGFTQKMMGSALDNFPNHKMNENWDVYMVKSSFFINFWPAFFNLSVILLVTGLVMLTATFTKGNVKIQGVLKSVSEVLKWNVFLVTFCGSMGDIVLFTALEFKSMQFENAEEVISFIVCLGINALAVIVVVQILDVNSALRRAKKDKLDEEQKKMIEKEWSSYKALFECYKDYSFYQQIFLFVFIMRSAIFYASVGYLYKYPLLQASTSLVTNILMLGYLIIKRPMRKMVNLIQQIVLEFVLLPFNICVLTLAIMDNQEIIEVDRRKAIGNVMFYINVMLPFLSMALMAAKFITMAIDFYKTWKMSKKAKGLANIQNKPFEALRNKSLTLTDNNNMTAIDLTDNSMMMMMSPETNMVRSHSRMIDNPANPRIRHSRPQIGNNHFLTPNMIQNFSMPPDNQGTFPEQQAQFQGEFGVQHVSQTHSVMELYDNENINQSIQRGRPRIKKSGRLRLQDNELIW